MCFIFLVRLCFLSFPDITSIFQTAPSVFQTNPENVKVHVCSMLEFGSCLGRPSHERHKFGKGLILKLGTPKGFKTWKAKS